jgi:excisionase family DNA binding protein
MFKDEKNDLLSYKEAAKILRLPLKTLYYLVKKRKIAHYRLGPKMTRFSRTEIQYLIESSKVPSIDKD